jgi:hypothetical protein
MLSTILFRTEAEVEERSRTTLSSGSTTVLAACLAELLFCRAYVSEPAAKRFPGVRRKNGPG